MTIALQQLLTQQSLDSIRAKVLGKLQNKGLPTTDWSPTGIERTIAEMVAEALFDMVVGGIPAAVGGGFVDYATGDWLTFNSQERYANLRNAATYTFGTIVLANSTGSPIPVAVDSLSFRFPSGNVYHGPIGIGPFNVPANGALSITVQSEQANHSVLLSATDTQPLVNYVDGSGLAIVMVTQVAGLTATNPAPAYSTVTQSGIGTGSVTPTGVPVGSHTINIHIDNSGQVAGALVYSYSLDGGAYVTGQTSATQTNIGGFGIGFTLANGAANPSFIAGTSYAFSSPGSWITTQGTDAEYDLALASRDKNRWPSLATLAAIPGSPTLGFYDLLARGASSQVTQTLVQTDANINNKVNIYVAGQAGVLPGGVISTINAFFAALNMLTDYPVAQSPAVLPIVIANLTITVKQSLLAAAQTALQATLQSYFASLGINASTTSGVIRHARLVQMIEDTTGVVDLTDTAMTINGAATSLTLPTVAGQAQLAQWTQQVASSFTWNTVQG